MTYLSGLASLATLPNVDGVYGDTDEWRQPWTRGNAILHIELRRWADILVIAPLSANTLAKIVGGMADGILTSVVRAWDARGELDSDVLALREETQLSETSGGDGVGVPGEPEAPIASGDGGGGNRTRARMTKKKKRIVVAPAMNTAMWRHPITAKQIRVLEAEWGVGNNKNNKKSSNTTPSSSSNQHDSSAANSNANRGAQPPQHQHSNSHHDDFDDDRNADEGEGWFEVLRPQTKLLACGDRGDGAMCEWTEIVRVIEDRLGLD
ncbi:putative phosphopantothenoylcysteine decarboxylase protein [Eutypa lata UCREL1]|uniref:Putative phosphopantothenoylcysteine decarboxylase protein n=1 Tax=Eutypa lata (strain UCR-EL1) TaxID=1287681 RepID=M7T3A0_EUTLA|nr:putative phosphopantothenoylcysteine decarboxylase protein [Eutypa lata UCREL1]